jgi:FkbH-like protein
MQDMLAAMNLLPHNVVFIDDNPAERAEMQAAFPTMRILGRNPFQIRRILMLAPETQVASVTDESARRTNMMQSQLQRETERAQLSPEAFARDQNVLVRISQIRSTKDNAFPRALELINKTNQFNTTGKRWSLELCRAHLTAGGTFAIYRVEGRHAAYGLVGVAIVIRDTILQWVMSCRVIGLGVEQTALHGVVKAMRQDGASRIWARLTKTELNATCQSFYKTAGFIERDGMFVLEPSAAVPPKPGSVRLEIEDLREFAAE